MARSVARFLSRFNWVGRQRRLFAQRLGRLRPGPLSRTSPRRPFERRRLREFRRTRPRQWRLALGDDERRLAGAAVFFYSSLRAGTRRWEKGAKKRRGEPLGVGRS